MTTPWVKTHTIQKTDVFSTCIKYDWKHIKEQCWSVSYKLYQCIFKVSPPSDLPAKLLLPQTFLHRNSGTAAAGPYILLLLKTLHIPWTPTLVVQSALSDIPFQLLKRTPAVLTSLMFTPPSGREMKASKASWVHSHPSRRLLISVQEADFTSKPMATSFPSEVSCVELNLSRGESPHAMPPKGPRLAVGWVQGTLSKDRRYSQLL